MHACIYMYAGVCVCMYVCMYVRMYNYLGMYIMLPMHLTKKKKNSNVMYFEFQS